MCLLIHQSAWAGAIIDGPNVRVTDAALNGAMIEDIRIIEQDGTLYAVWVDFRDRDTFDNFGAIYFAKSTDGGVTWGPNIRVSELPYDDWVNHPDIAVQPDGTIWVVWHLFYNDEVDIVNDIRVAKSTDGGASFTVSNLVNGPDGYEDFWRTRIVANATNGDLYVISQLADGETVIEGTQLFLVRYDAAAESWGTTATIINDVSFAGRLSGESLDIGAWFSLTTRDGVVCAAWEDRGRNTEERHPIYGACSTDGGETFEANFKISGDDGIRPEIALGPDGELYAAYAIDTDNHHNIKLRLSTDLGATWGPERSVTDVDSFEVKEWMVEVDANGQVVLAYVRTLGVSSDLYLSTSIDQGENFSYAILGDSQGAYPDTAEQWAPALAVGGTGEATRAYVAWDDDRNIDNEMWSVRAVLDGLPPTVPTNVTISPEERALRLSWDNATDATGISGYRVYRATSGAGPYTEITARLVQNASYVDVELDENTYFYQVAAVDGTGNTGPVSDSVSGAALAAGDPTYGGKIAYETGQPTNVRIRNLIGDPDEITITEASQPRFATGDSRIYYHSGTSIASRPLEEGETTLFFDTPGLVEYDLAENESYYAAIISRNFAAPGAVGGFCYVSEPNYGRPGQNLYVNEYDLASDIAISNDRKWMAYRTAGWCSPAATGIYTPPDFCLVDLTTGTDSCLSEDYNYRTPDFAPTGHWLVFSADFTGQEEIWKAQVQPGGWLAYFTQLTRGAANQPSRAPSWSTDGNWIVFQRDIDPAQDEDWQLYVVRADGVGVRSLGIAGEYPAWLGGGPAGDSSDPGDPDDPLDPSQTHMFLPLLND